LQLVFNASFFPHLGRNILDFIAYPTSSVRITITAQGLGGQPEGEAVRLEYWSLSVQEQAAAASLNV